MSHSSQPKWLADLRRLLPIRSQFVVAGNIRDSCLVDVASRPMLVPLLRALWETLRQDGYRALLVFDPLDGVRVYPDRPPLREQVSELFDLKLGSTGVQPMSLESLASLMRQLGTERRMRCALVIDYGSRVARQPNHLADDEHQFFLASEKLSLEAVPLAGAESGGEQPLFNPVIWLLNRAQDLPSWLTLDSERVASLAIGLPDYGLRMAAARQLAPLFAGYGGAGEAMREWFVDTFASGTEGMSLNALADITQLAEHESLSLRELEDAIRGYKIGRLDNPWQQPYLHARVRDAATTMASRVKGQQVAMAKTLDIVKRSIVGLTGAQARSVGNRPRGVLFFAGPTGVGKTELAKALTQAVFGHEDAYLRFDMSEFSQEHTGARLLGAPPGYVGFDAGGELTNSVREKPFSLILFDEIEKAHPRILDKFLQILEDGRLTDGQGKTTYFSETIIVFTSNLGMYVQDEQGRRIQNVRPDDDYDTVRERMLAAIDDYFKVQLSRPEILNRIGDNVVVFDFIRPDVAAEIFDGMLRNVARRLQHELKLRLSVAADVRARLLELCTHDLANGGRGIGNQLESVFINPLSRALFGQDLQGRQAVAVTGIDPAEHSVALQIRLM